MPGDKTDLTNINYTLLHEQVNLYTTLLRKSLGCGSLYLNISLALKQLCKTFKFIQQITAKKDIFSK